MVAVAARRNPLPSLCAPHVSVIPERHVRLELPAALLIFGLWWLTHVTLSAVTATLLTYVHFAVAQAVDKLRHTLHILFLNTYDTLQPHAG